MPVPDQILTVAQMRATEDALIAAGSSVEALMDIAGRGAAAWVWRLSGGHPVTVLCGPGNNGGDGYVIAQALRERGGEVVVIAPMPPTTPAAKAARASFQGSVLDERAPAQDEVFVDCLFGSGLSRPLAPEHGALLARLAAGHRLSIAVDMPSGIHSDSGEPLGEGLPAYDLTLALGAWKPAHFLMPAAARLGARRLVPIGVAPVAGAARVLCKPLLAAPPADAHKYSRGLVCVIGGAMPGAAGLAAEAAARAGAGYVRLSSPQPVRASHAVVQSREAHYDRARAVLVGPGLGRDAPARKVLADALASGLPVVADADALWWLAEEDAAGLGVPAIVTPHEGEFTRLYDREGKKIEGSKIDRARAAAASSGSVIVYKGADTIVAAPDGRGAVAQPSSSWLSTAGTGDILAGLCAARLAVGGDPFEAACQAVWLHGEAARQAGASFVADDLIARVPAALEACL